MVKFRDGWVRLVFVLALLLPVWFLVAALGTKFGLLDWRIGFGLMVFRLGSLLLLGVLGLSVIGLLLALLVKPRRGWGRALVAVLIPALALGFAASVMSKARAVPPIHDISTNIEDPPVFSRTVLDARGAVGGANPVRSLTEPSPALKGRSVGEAGRAAYPDIEPVTLAGTVPESLERAAAAARSQGLKDVRIDKAAGTVEAVAESFWFGFRDDVVIRVRPGPDGQGSVVDIRSTSRVGQSDLGANAARVRGLIGAIKAE